MTFFVTARPFTRQEPYARPFRFKTTEPRVLRVETPPCVFCTRDWTAFDPTYLHDAFLCGVLPRVMKWHTDTRGRDGPESASRDSALLHNLLVYLEKDCDRFQGHGELYSDYCYFWSLEYAANITAVIRGETPPFVHVFETYRKMFQTTS